MAGLSLQLKLSLIGLALATLVASLNFLNFTNTQQLRYEIDHLRNELQERRKAYQKARPQLLYAHTVIQGYMFHAGTPTAHNTT